jgi:DNA-binding transcriptional LysR family regulator
MILAPLAFEYLRRYPKVGVDLVTEDALVDVVGQGFDAGIRLAEFVPPDMIAVPINRTLRSVVVGSPGYFNAHGRPKTPTDLTKHRCIRSRMASGVIYRWEFEARRERDPGRAGPSYSGRVRLDAAGGAGRGGAGLSLAL